MKTSENLSKKCLNLKKEKNNIKPKAKFKVEKSISKDPKVFAKQSVLVKRLTLNEIKKYDKHFYRKYSQQLKAENDYNKYSKLNNNLNKANESPRMRLWANISPKVSPNYCFLRNTSQHNRNINFDEPESSLMNASEYCRYLNLISVKEMKRIPLQQLKNSFNIRNIGRNEIVKRNANNDIIIDGQTLMDNMIHKFKPIKTELNIKEKKLKSKKHRKLFNVNKIRKKYKLLENQRKSFAKQWKEQYKKVLTTFPLLSPMGQRIYTSMNSQCLGTNKIESIIRKNELYCSTKIRIRQSNETRKLNKWRPKNIERIAFATDFGKNRWIGCHQYSFTKRQRLEKLKRFECGLNWKSRLLALKCDRLAAIVLHKTIFCPICGHNINDNHSCDTVAIVNAFESKSEVPIKRKLNESKNEIQRKRNKTVNYLDNEKRKTNSKARNSLDNKSRKCFVKIERMNPKVIQRVCKIDLDEERKRVVEIDLDKEEKRIITINLDNSSSESE